MKLFTRDELVSLYRRSVGLQKDVPNDAVARQTKRWSKRTLAGKIHGLVKARTFGMVEGIVFAVAAILAGGWGLFRRGDRRTEDASSINGRAATYECASYSGMDGSIDGVAEMRGDRRTAGNDFGDGGDSLGCSTATRAGLRSAHKQRLLVATLIAVLAGGGAAGITHGIKLSARTRIRNRFAKQLRTLRAKRPSATTRRLTRFVKRFVGKK